MGVVTDDAGAETRLGWLRSHPAPRFVLTGGATFLVDLGCLRLLHGTAGLALAPATLLAFCIAFVVNFTASRNWAFAGTGRDGHVGHQALRYLVLVAANLASTLAIVVGLNALDVNYLWAKVVAAAVNATFNFFAYRHWVFAAPPVL